MYAKSELRKTGEVGEALLEALGGGGAAWARKKRAEAGVAPDAELEHVGKAAGDQYRCCARPLRGILDCQECRRHADFGVHVTPSRAAIRLVSPHSRVCCQQVLQGCSTLGVKRKAAEVWVPVPAGFTGMAAMSQRSVRCSTSS